MKIIIRHAAPNEWDEAEKGTICRVILNSLDGTTAEYIQRSDDAEKPRWEKI